MQGSASPRPLPGSGYQLIVSALLANPFKAGSTYAGSASPRPLPGSGYQLIVSAPLANSYRRRVYISGECFAKTTTR
jgi:hypothetical protein